MPLEKILDLNMPEELVDDRQGVVWSTDTLLATFALDRGRFNLSLIVLNAESIRLISYHFLPGFLTAKAARPDVYRSGSMLIRAFHTSQIAWSFRPSMWEVPDIHQEGIWLPDFQAGKAGDIGSVASNLVALETTDVGETTGFDDASSEEASEISEGESENEDEESEEYGDDNSNPGPTPSTTGQRTSAFALLALDDGGEGDEGDDGSASS